MIMMRDYEKLEKFGKNLEARDRKFKLFLFTNESLINLEIYKIV